LAQGLIGGESFCAVEGVSKTGEDCRRERDGLTRGDVGRQQGVQASGRIARQPATDGVPMDAEELCHILAGVGVPTRQDIQPLEAGLLVSVMFPLKPVFEVVRMCGHGRNGPTAEILRPGTVQGAVDHDVPDGLRPKLLAVWWPEHDRVDPAFRQQTLRLGCRIHRPVDVLADIETHVGRHDGDEGVAQGCRVG
jgi:hypothetical protein